MFGEKIMKKVMFSVLFVLLFFLSSTVSAQEVLHNDGYHNHDGIFLRLSGGLGYSALFSTEDVASGISMLTTLSIGGAVRENLILNVEFYGSRTLDLTYNSDTIDDDGYGVDMTFSGVGFGITHYFMPNNSYVSFSVGFGGVGAQDGFMGISAEFKRKFALNFVFGKEWWVNDSWALGLGGQLFYSPVGKTGYYSNNDDYYYDEDSDYIYKEPEDHFINFIGGGMVFTATYN